MQIWIWIWIWKLEMWTSASEVQSRNALSTSNLNLNALYVSSFFYVWLYTSWIWYIPQPYTYKSYMAIAVLKTWRNSRVGLLIVYVGGKLCQRGNLHSPQIFILTPIWYDWTWECCDGRQEVNAWTAVQPCTTCSLDFSTTAVSA